MTENEKLFDDARSLVYTARTELAGSSPHRHDTAMRLLTEAYEKMQRIRPPEIAEVTRAMHSHAHELQRLASRLDKLAELRPPQATEKDK